MRNKTLAAVLCVAALGLVGAGCGDDNDDEAASGTTTEMTTPAAEAQDIVATAQATPELSTLVAAVTAADLGATLQGDGPYTVFAPTNDAFAAIQDTVDTLLKPENKDQLADVLKYHVVEGMVMAADLEDGQEVTTLQGDKLTVSIDGDTVKVGDATVTQADVEASNGVVHVIDTVLVPAS